MLLMLGVNADESLAASDAVAKSDTSLKSCSRKNDCNPCKKPDCGPPPCPQPEPPMQYCPSTCPADPCCPPWPMPVLNAAYNYPALIETRCPWYFSADVSFIYWQPSEENLELGFLNTNSPGFSTPYAASSR